MQWLWLSSLLLMLCTQILLAQDINPCLSKTTCGQCIQTLGCEWCRQVDDFVNEDGSEKPRCNTVEGNLQSKCKLPVSPDSSVIFEQNDPVGIGSGGRIVQLKPQKVDLNLRVNEEYILKVVFAHTAEGFPVDLYYLMDLSESMKNDKDKLEVLASDIAERMNELTPDFRLGFGSFVDKAIMPYYNTVHKKLNRNQPYGFINHISLTANVDQVEKSVKKAKTAGNLDSPEGGFDGIMQVMACENIIGWRNFTRRLLLYATDAPFHYAGDGKLGGIVAPNDGYCHLDSKGQYTHSQLFDYPSVSHINNMAIEKSLNVIFAVTEEHENIYEPLKNSIQGASVGILAEDSSNIVELIEEEYKKIRSEVELQVKGASEHVQVKFYSECLGTSLEETNKCEGMKLEEMVEFDAHILVTRVPENRSLWNQLITIYPVGISEALDVNLTIIAECDCEHQGNPGFVSNAKKCSNSGNLTCGICSCESDHYGKFCECDQSTEEEGEASNCKPFNSSSDLLCSGHGDCVCGVCQCHRIDDQQNYFYYGAFCECDNLSCDRSGGLLCSGPDHGVCECGKCKCNAGWTGSACECDDSIGVCVYPGDSQKCSGHGTCVCGQCQCFESSLGSYHGTYCEEEPNIFGMCADLRHCVQCQVFQSGIFTSEECAEKCTFPIELVEEIQVGENEEKCTFTDNDDDCDFIFVYSYDNFNLTEFGNSTDKTPKVRAQETKICPPILKQSIIVVVALSGVIVAIGVALLLLWKFCITLHDKRELAKFEQETAKATWQTDANPLYIQPTTHFNNPTFGKK